MGIPAIRTKQTTNTTGTGTLTLIAAAADFRSLATAFGGSSIKVRYILSRSGLYEVGYGTFNGSNQLTRDTVVASSNGGSLVNLSAGTTDVFFDFMPGDREVRTVSSNTTLALADIGNLVRCTQTADITLTLPAVATVPPGTGYLIRNDGTNNSIVSIDPNGAELLDASSVSYPLFSGEAVEIFSIGTAWKLGVGPSGWRVFGRSSASSSASVDFVLPSYPSISRSSYRVDFRQVRPATDGAYLTMRVDDAGGASFDAGASDYSHSSLYVSGASAVAGAANTGDSAIRLSTDIDITATGNTLFGTVEFNPGASAVRFPSARVQSFAAGNGTIYAGPQRWAGAGARLSAIDANAIRFLMNTGNIALGDFTLSALFD